MYDIIVLCDNQTLGLLLEYIENEDWSSYVERVEFISLQMTLKVRIKRQFYIAVAELLLLLLSFI